jgi:CheY-like chemotaxis protein/HAMP domain-containing protein
MDIRKKQNSFSSKVGLGFSMLGLIFIAALVISLYKLKGIEQSYRYVHEINQNLFSKDEILNAANNSDKLNEAAKIIEDTKKSIISIINTSRSNVHELWMTIWGFLVIGLFLFALFGIILTKSITRPLNTLVKTTKQLAKGKIQQKFSISGNLEFEMLSEALNELIDTLQEIANVTEKMAEGDYSQRVRLKSEEDILAITVNQMLDNFNNIVEQANAIAKGDYSLDVSPRSHNDLLGTSLNNMTLTLRKNALLNQEERWLKDGLAELASVISGHSDLATLCSKAISMITRYLDAAVGAVFVYNKKSQVLKLYGSFAFTERQSLANKFKLGEGIIGQVALEKQAIILRSSETEECLIKTGVSQQTPKAIYTFPIVYESELIAVIELASCTDFNKQKKLFSERMVGILAAQIKAAQQQSLTEKLLQESELLTTQLTKQQEAMQKSNIELERQTNVLKESELQLKQKDEQQQAINAKLAERTKELEKQKKEVEEKNIAIKKTSRELKEKANELEKASAYKSEFLANMSHELRTPLNSLLILASLLADNEEGNLSEEQVEYAQIIAKSGKDLLTLINDILDLAKVEAGKIELVHNDIKLKDFVDTIDRDFGHVAEQKGIGLITQLNPDLPVAIHSDDHRILQIIRNLISNAIKFTEAGDVRFTIGRPDPTLKFKKKKLDLAKTIAMSVTDTGIGIPEDKQDLVFKSFQQADGTTSRQYGGTGLGLSISSQLAELLGGEIVLTSTYGSGSTFTLCIPETPTLDKEYQHQKTTEIIKKIDERIKKDPEKKHSVEKHEQSILIIEDNKSFADIVINLCEKKGYRCLHADTGESGFQYALEYQPQGILLDLGLPDIDGLTLLEQLKSNKKTQHIPVQILSASDVNQTALEKGAIGFLTKPISPEELDKAIQHIEELDQRNIKSLLIVEDDKNMASTLKHLLKNKNMMITNAYNGQEALEAMNKSSFDCIILDLGLPDMTGKQLLEEYNKTEHDNQPSIIIHTGRELSQEERASLNNYADSIILKGSQSSGEQLLKILQTSMSHGVHHIVEKKITSELKKSITEVKTIKPVQKLIAQGNSVGKKDKTILIVDDDMRNTFALSKAVGAKGYNILLAGNGEKAIEALEKNHNIHLVLMDIMMPVMDGYEAMVKIRTYPEFKELPIIALTAKAMTGDRERCIEAGASDFLSKPIDLPTLLAMIEQWIK